MRLGIFLSLLFLSASLLGQSIHEQSLKLKSGALHLASIKDTIKPHHLILAFTDDVGERWKYTSWTQELHWLARERNALVVSPETKNRELTWADLNAVIQLFNDSVESIENTEFIALGSGVTHAPTMIENAFNGLLISPSAQVSVGDIQKTTALGVVKTIETDSSSQVAAQLERAGAWVLYDQQFGADYYYVDGYKQFYLDAFEKVDSVHLSMVNDSLQEFRTSVAGNLPDVIRQGQKVEVEIMVYQNGEYIVDLFDLSAKSVFHRELYLGKGRHMVELKTNDLDWGVYKLQISGSKFLYKHKIMIRG